MKKMKKRIALLCLTALTIGFMASCRRMDVGYLRTTGASFTPDSINVSTRIQGVAGTNPVNFELAGVKAGSPEQEQLFLKLCREGEISVTGGLVVVSLKAVKQLPNGRYQLSFRVYNEDHEAVLEDVFKVVVTDDELPLD